MASPVLPEPLELAPLGNLIDIERAIDAMRHPSLPPPGVRFPEPELAVVPASPGLVIPAEHFEEMNGRLGEMSLFHELLQDELAQSEEADQVKALRLEQAAEAYDRLAQRVARLEAELSRANCASRLGSRQLCRGAVLGKLGDQAAVASRRHRVRLAVGRWGAGCRGDLGTGRGMDRAVAYWKKRQRRRGVRHWNSHGKLRGRQRLLMKCAAMRMRYAGYAAAMATWGALAAAGRRRAFVMRGAVMRMLNRRLSMAWEQWQQTAAEMRAQRRLLGRAARRFRNAKMFAAWNSWRSWCAEMRRQRYILRGALSRMRNRKLSMAWEQWQQVCAEMRSQRHLMCGAINRMRNRMLSMAWEQWQQVAAIRRAEVAKAREIIAKMRHFYEGQGYRAWQDYVTTQNVARGVTFWIYSKWLSTLQRLSDYSNYMGRIEDLIEASEDGSRDSQKLLRAAVLRWRQREMKLAFRSMRVMLRKSRAFRSRRRATRRATLTEWA